MSSITRAPVKTVEVGPDAEYETTRDAITVVFERSDQEPLPMSWVLLDGDWLFAKGTEIPDNGP